VLNRMALVLALSRAFRYRRKSDQRITSRCKLRFKTVFCGFEGAKSAQKPSAKLDWHP
jgi:hypothetical protein